MITSGQIRERIEFACNANSVPELANKITFEFNNRFTAKAGEANYSKNNIRISTKLFARASEAEQVETVIHEASHLISYAKHGKIGRGHKDLWKATMRNCGVIPNRTHNIDCTGLARKNSTHTITCSKCGHNITISSNRVTRMINGTRYVHKTCGAIITAPHLGIS